MVRADQLLPGDEILGWLKSGHALRSAKNFVTGEMYRFVPGRPERYERDDLSRFVGLLTRNDTVNRILTVEVQAVNRFAQACSPTMRAEIPYMALSRLRRLSKINYPGKPQNPRRPTQIAIGSENRAYRTIEEVLLKWD